ncbi:tRNA pseudouridine(55) synthase TruB [Patescibacteria group bacterium]|nr:tRNA pseudouridine(55) synthase TruB [Patescibacteria group bacterium]MBU1683118.1 tRNA pseudouridine(55) synthase TruB [Patescibacteria group bacterium]MBU1934761.1 tRNA pseudouridine(55) synthase TruB [Patescibacteria group bacterium]
MNGLLVINKEKGWTSFDVVAKIRNKLGVKKVGHTGTLDPMATGVLVLCLGKATKLAQKIVDTKKEYIAEITFGATSTTDDAEGVITKSKIPNPKNKEDINQALKNFEGTIMQMPPQFSAKKVGGKRAYKMAREGKKVELKPVEITIHELEILDYKWPILKIRVACSKGTYLRSLARDLGEKLKVGGYLTALQRTRVGQYSLDQAVRIEEAGENSVIQLSEP